MSIKQMITYIQEHKPELLQTEYMRSGLFLLDEEYPIILREEVTRIERQLAKLQQTK